MDGEGIHVLAGSGVDGNSVGSGGTGGAHKHIGIMVIGDGLVGDFRKGIPRLSVTVTIAPD